jgi:hypothetical protein
MILETDGYKKFAYGMNVGIFAFVWFLFSPPLIVLFLLGAYASLMVCCNEDTVLGWVRGNIVSQMLAIIIKSIREDMKNFSKLTCLPISILLSVKIIIILILCLFWMFAEFLFVTMIIWK